MILFLGAHEALRLVCDGCSQAVLSRKESLSLGVAGWFNDRELRLPPGRWLSGFKSQNIVAEMLRSGCMHERKAQERSKEGAA